MSRATDEMQSPLLADVGVIALVPDHWDWNWQARHQVISRLSRYFHVVWMNPALDWQDAWSWRHPPRRLEAPPAPASTFVVCEPGVWLPRFYRPSWLAGLTERLRLRRARGLLRRRACRRIILSLWRPEFARALEDAPCDLSCYHVDDEYTFSSNEQPTSDTERRVLESAGRVFIHSPSLMQKKGQFNPNTTYVPSGVDYKSFSSPVPEPSDLVAIARPRIGYSGWIKRQLDWDLLFRLTAEHPEWHFVFVGAAQLHGDMPSYISQMKSRPNAYFLGSKTAPELAAYAQHFDACIMPYRMDHYTKYIYPLKLHEYLASGRPVVGTRLPSLEQFAGMIALVKEPDEWTEAIGTALRPNANAAECREKRQAVARAHDWEILVARIAGKMAEGLGPSYVDRFLRAVGPEG